MGVASVERPTLHRFGDDACDSSHNALHTHTSHKSIAGCYFPLFTSNLDRTKRVEMISFSIFTAET